MKLLRQEPGASSVTSKLGGFQPSRCISRQESGVLCGLITTSPILSCISESEIVEPNVAAKVVKNVNPTPPIHSQIFILKSPLIVFNLHPFLSNRWQVSTNKRARVGTFAQAPYCPVPRVSTPHSFYTRDNLQKTCHPKY